MIAVYKYTLGHWKTTLNLPAGARPLSVGLQDGEFRLWCLVAPENPIQNRTFLVVPTGSPFDMIDAVFIGTIRCDDGSVFHAFEVA